MKSYSQLVESRLQDIDDSCDSRTTLRQIVLRETIQAFSRPNTYHHTATSNLHNWKKEASSHNTTHIFVVPQDWGTATLNFTSEYGHMFTVLNMANPIHPGGGYLHGCVAQEENMFRRSDCHFSIEDQYDHQFEQYHKSITDLLLATNNKVYIDTTRPRICIRDKEDYSKSNLGYDWLEPSKIFPFIEMRASAIDCTRSPFCINEARKRISSQFQTLISNNIKHVILGAFGCGAFNNPPDIIANLYKEQILQHQSNFSVIVFAIYNAGYGPDNYSVFKDIIAQ